MRSSIMHGIFISLFTSIVVLYGHGGGTSIDDVEEDMEIERELSIINKPGVKTIKTKYGDIYSCVDIDKQPAFDHPLLKSHKVQIISRRTFRKNVTAPADYPAKKLYQSKAHPAKFGLRTHCPKGTVPIRRITKEELRRAKFFYKGHSSHNLEFTGSAGGGTGIDLALMYMNMEPDRKCQGAEAHINLHQPKVENQQYSAAIVKVQSGYPGQKGYVQSGWMVNKDLYNDGRVRLFISWKEVYSGRVSGCFNLYCPGFVATNPGVPPDIILEPYSEVLGPQYEIRVSIEQHPDSGNWYLWIQDNIPIGYWPKELFYSLGNGADIAYWGGLVYSSTSKSPPMGNGQFKFGGDGQTCFMRLLQVLKHGDPAYTKPDNSFAKSIESRCYHINLRPDWSPDWGYRINFGGPGGDYDHCFI